MWSLFLFKTNVNLKKFKNNWKLTKSNWNYPPSQVDFKYFSETNKRFDFSQIHMWLLLMQTIQPKLVVKIDSRWYSTEIKNYDNGWWRSLLGKDLVY